MNKNIAWAIAITIIAATMAACQSALPSLSPTNTTDASRRSITVSGQGTVTAKPEFARLNLGVDVLTPTLAESMRQNSAKMTAVIAKLKALGVPDKDVQTSNLNVNVERNSDRTGQNTVTGYRVSNNVVVVIRDMNKISDTLDQSVQAGANSVNGISFGIDNTDKQESQARSLAVADAQARADDIAKLNGVQRGEVIAMSEGSNASTFSLKAAPLAFGLGGGGTPIESGSLEIQVQVQITYSVK